MKIVGKGVVKRLVLETLGWLLVIVGLAALVLPGPGLLALFAGIALLATQYEWAERRVEPLKETALRVARDSVSSWRNIVISLLGVACLIAFGILWGLQPDQPSWWPLSDALWLPGGWGTGASLIGSAFIALSLVIYSYIKLRNR